jgi:hypothetical protein
MEMLTAAMLAVYVGIAAEDSPRRPSCAVTAFGATYADLQPGWRREMMAEVRAGLAAAPPMRFVDVFTATPAAEPGAAFSAAFGDAA